MQIFMRHVRAAKLCSRGARAWGERHGFDYTRFLRNGIPEEELAATGCGLAARVIAAAHAEAAEKEKGR